MSMPSNPQRADPFDLGDFAPTTAAKPKPAAALIREVSEANNFPSRAAATKPAAAPAKEARTQRRHRTGRNVQFNLKVTAETAERFAKVSDAQGWVFGETLERALDALEASLKTSG